LVLSDSGFLAAYIPGRGWCPQSHDFRASPMLHMFLSGDRGILIGGGSGQLILMRMQLSGG
jgi:hypothetical protein